MDDFKNIVRIGTVSSVNAAEGTARVAYDSLNKMVSGPLRLLQHPPNPDWVPTVGQTVLCLYLPVFDGDGFVLGVV